MVFVQFPFLCVYPFVFEGHGGILNEERNLREDNILWKKKFWEKEGNVKRFLGFSFLTCLLHCRGNFGRSLLWTKTYRYVFCGFSLFLSVACFLLRHFYWAAFSDNRAEGLSVALLLSVTTLLGSIITMTTIRKQPKVKCFRASYLFPLLQQRSIVISPV